MTSRTVRPSKFKIERLIITTLAKNTCLLVFSLEQNSTIRQVARRCLDLCEPACRRIRRYTYTRR